MSSTSLGQAQRKYYCPHCGAVREISAAPCWLCGSAPTADVKGSTHIVPQHRAPAVPPRGVVSYSLSTLMLATTLAALACGLMVVLPGLGIVFCILLAPVLVRTAMVVRRREAAGKPVSRAEKIALFTTSLGVAGVILAVVGVASVGTFCGVCFGEFMLLEALRPRGEPWGLIIAIWAVPILTALAVTIPIIRLLYRWVRKRFERDVEGDHYLP